MTIFETRRGVFVLLGAFFALLAVVVGAAASHALQSRMDPQHLNWITIGQRYLLWHSLALVALDCLPVSAGPDGWRSLAGYCFLGGCLLFTGSLWAMGALDATGLAVLTPVGGFSFIAGWACLIVHALRLIRQGR